MMEDTCWKQFMTTGKVEDYLKFKAQEDRNEPRKGSTTEGYHAGFGENDRDGTGQCARGGI